MLATRGVPWDVAIRLTPTELLGYCVVVGELEGGRFDWTLMRWKDPKA